MCKYFIDTEFHEYKKQPTVCGIKVGKPIDTIELISIGIVSEDIIKDGYAKGIDATIIQRDNQQTPSTNKVEYDVIPRNYGNKEYYAICKDFDIKAAWDNKWLRENVLIPIVQELANKELNEKQADNDRPGVSNSKFVFWWDGVPYSKYKRLINKYGKTREEIAGEIIQLTEPYYWQDKDGNPLLKEDTNKYPIEFYAYYADYDWVVFCWLFGRMIDLPNGFPMYCKDLKQMLDEADKRYVKEVVGSKTYELYKGDLHIKRNIDYPKQTDEHNALADAKWNKKLYEFINTL